MERAKLKEKAKSLLKGNYTPLALGVLVFMIASMFGSILDQIFHVDYLTYVFSFVAEILFMMGFVDSVMKITREKKVEVENLFKHMDLGLKYLVLSLIIGLIIGFLSLLLAIASKSLSTVLINMSNIGPILFIFLVIIGSLLILAILVFMIYLVISFSQVYFILNDEPEEKIGEILNKSFDMLDGYRLEYFMLVLSFVGWMILGVFTLGILYLWLVPYMMVTFALFYEKIKDRYSYSAPLKDEEILKLDGEPVKDEIKIEKKPLKKTKSKKSRKKVE